MRCGVWKLICRIDEVKERTLTKYLLKRTNLHKKMQALKKKHKEFVNPELMEKKKIDDKFQKIIN